MNKYFLGLTIGLLFAVLALAGWGGPLPPPTDTPMLLIDATASPTDTPVPPAPTAVPTGVSHSDCQTCHEDVHTDWTAGRHSDTQADVSSELAEERADQTPDEVVNGDDPETCVACHAPTAVLANGGMNESEALDYFFTTGDGKFTADTTTAHLSEWPSVACTACHDQHNPTQVSYFNASTQQYEPMGSASELCGQCHGNLRFPDTDHLTYNKWAASTHSNTQADVASELAGERADQTPDEVVNGDDPETCVACHAPTAVLANGGMNESEALDYFFTTGDGKFTADTTTAHLSEWPSVACTACHDQHNPTQVSYFNASTQQYESMGSASELCGQCHGDLRFPDTDHLTYNAWAVSRHSDTQADVASELAEERSDQTPDEVVNGDDPENCVACHAPTAVLANGGMNEAEALDYFFTTSDGKFTADTTTAHRSEWPSVACTACHDQHNPTKVSYFDASTQQYETMGDASELCGQCHGDLRFPDTDHLTYNAWAVSRHSDTQADVASELAEERSDQTPDEVVNGDDPENCVACHAPTAVLANGGMNEAEALDYFFTTSDGKFTADTTTAHRSEWPSVACTACHDQHNPTKVSYFDASTQQYETMGDASELCGQCHGNLRFPDTDHLSYNIMSGTGGVGVPDQQTMPDVGCTDCHMFASDAEDSNSTTLHGHTWAVTVQEEDGQSTISCMQCHADFDDETANSTIAKWKLDFQALDATVQRRVYSATEATQGVTDETLQAKLAEAQQNLEYAESDESGGFHNHNYLMDLLNDSNVRALEVLDALGK